MELVCISRDTRSTCAIMHRVRCDYVSKVRERKRWWRVAKGKELKGLRAMLLRRNPFPTLPFYVLRRDARTRCLLASPYVVWPPTHTYAHIYTYAHIRPSIHAFALAKTTRFNLDPMRAAILWRWPTLVQPSHGRLH